jgi:hypothetical protein
MSTNVEQKNHTTKSLDQMFNGYALALTFLDPKFNSKMYAPKGFGGAPRMTCQPFVPSPYSSL